MMNALTNIKTKSKQTIMKASANYVVNYMQKDPEHNFDPMMKMLSSLDGMFGGHGQFKAVMEWIHEHPGTNKWFTHLMSRNPDQVKTFVNNFFGNCGLKWVEKSDVVEKKSGFCPPFAILISPSMRCNLHCKGCYAASYDKNRLADMDEATIEKIITEGKELGVYFYTIVGGEPFVVFDTLYKIAKKHNDCLFQVFTNGTLITDEVADKILELKNLIVAFSVNGNREDTDYMRGQGTYDKVLESVARLRERNLMYGMSLVLTSKNYETLMSRDFLKFWEDQGVVYGWNFLFMPVGPNPDLSLMPTPEQRITWGEFIKEYREKEPLYIMDFWADAPSVNGCIAGGRRFIHINNKGDIEPCIFAHYATHNIHDCHLVDALKSPFFTFIRMSEPHTDNLLRPCMIIDNPEIWRTACTRYNAHPTDLGAEELVKNPNIMKELDRYSAAVAKIADPLWEKKYKYIIDDIAKRKCNYSEGIDRIEYKLNRKEFLEKIETWAKENPAFADNMIESLEHATTFYGSDAERHTQFV
jgi:MoaA/NifB/PqqE/SkfB family radical SAM enzyme